MAAQALQQGNVHPQDSRALLVLQGEPMMV